MTAPPRYAGGMRRVLLAAVCLALTGCWKEIHEANATPRPDRPTLAQDQTARPEHSLNETASAF